MAGSSGEGGLGGMAGNAEQGGGSGEGGTGGGGDAGQAGSEPGGSAGQGEIGGQGGAGQGGTGGAVVAYAVQGVALGDENSCALVEQGRVKCWGRSQDGQLGLGDSLTRGDQPGQMGNALPFVDFGTDLPVSSLVSGANYDCALIGQQVKCWGSNEGGKLGLGDTVDRGNLPGQMGSWLPFIDLGTGVQVASIAASAGTSCAIFGDGHSKCWGDNSYGQLGIGDPDNRGESSSEMGDALPFVDLGTEGKLVSIYPGMTHTCALFQDGRVKCWGRGAEAALGLEDSMDRGKQPGQMGDALPFVNLGENARVVSLALGFQHTCALLDDGALKCWGSSTFGELGLGDTWTRGWAPGQMGDALPVVDLGSEAKAIAISSACYHTCALLEGGQVKCWGANWSGQLGLGDAQERGRSPGEMGDALPFVSLGMSAKAVDVVASCSGTCVRLDGGALKCWGLNNRGQLGLGDANVRGVQATDMGDALPAVNVGTQ